MIVTLLLLLFLLLLLLLFEIGCLIEPGAHQLPKLSGLKSQRSCCLYLSSIWIPSACLCVWLLSPVGAGIQAQTILLTQQVFLSHFPAACAQFMRTNTEIPVLPPKSHG